MYVLLKSIYTIIFCLIKSSYTERKEVKKNFLKEVDFSYFLRCLWQFCYRIQSQVLWLLRFVCLKYKEKPCDSYTIEIHLFEIQRQILGHQIFICSNLKLYFAIFDYKVKLYEQKIVFYELWLAQRNFLPVCNYSWVR